MARTRRKSAYLILESTYGVDPSPSGSNYLPLPAESLGELMDRREMLETGYGSTSGREWISPVEPGAAGAELQFTMPLWGLASAAGDATNAATVLDDAWDLILEHLFGSKSTTAGSTVTFISGSDLTLGADVFSVNDPVLTYEPGLAGQTRAQVRRIATDTGIGQYTVDAAFDSNDGGSAVAYGSKIYRPNQPYVGGNTLALAYRDDDVGVYTCLGGRITSFSIEAAVNQRAMASFTIMFDSMTLDGAKVSLPAALSAPPVTPVQLRWSPLRFNGTNIGVASISLDFGVTAAPVRDTDRANGRADYEAITMRPVVTVNPLRTDAVRQLKTTAQQGEMGLQFGGGILSGGRINSVFIGFPAAQVVGGDPEDDEGYARHGLQIEAKDPGSSAPFVDMSRF